MLIVDNFSLNKLTIFFILLTNVLHSAREFPILACVLQRGLEGALHVSNSVKYNIIKINPQKIKSKSIISAPDCCFLCLMMV